VAAPASEGLGPGFHLIEMDEVKLQVLDAEAQDLLDEIVVAGIVAARHVAKSPAWIVADRAAPLIEHPPRRRAPALLVS
jgi:hypothetical protein